MRAAVNVVLGIALLAGIACVQRLPLDAAPCPCSVGYCCQMNRCVLGACGSPDAAGSTSSAGTSGATGTVGAAGATGTAGDTAVAGAGGAGTAGATGTAGIMATAGAGGAGPAGNTSTAGADAATAGADAAAAGADAAADSATDLAEVGIDVLGFEPGDTLPWRPLHVTATAAIHVRGIFGMDGRARPLGKLAVDLGVSGGGYSSFLGKRGYHVLGAVFGQCLTATNWALGRDVADKCHQGEWDMIAADVKARLTSASQQYPEEDWGYFLNQDGSVRWSDVAITGFAEGGNTAAFAGRIAVRAWRVVARSAPRDNICGIGAGGATRYDPMNPPWFPVAATCDAQHCCLAHIASWLDAPSKTPVDRVYALVGMKDNQYGDIMFDLDRTGIPGQPVIWDLQGAILSGTNRFISILGGHLDFLNAAPNINPPNTDAVLDIAFGVPPENRNPTF
jgi:hypothetical protein